MHSDLHGNGLLWLCLFIYLLCLSFWQQSILVSHQGHCVCVCVAREEKEKSHVFQSVVHLVTKEPIYHKDASLYTKHHNKSIMSVMQVKLNKMLCIQHANKAINAFGLAKTINNSDLSFYCSHKQAFYSHSLPLSEVSICLMKKITGHAYLMSQMIYWNFHFHKKPLSGAKYWMPTWANLVYQGPLLWSLYCDSVKDMQYFVKISLTHFYIAQCSALIMKSLLFSNNGTYSFSVHLIHI